MLLRMVLCAAMQTTHTITSMEPAAESRPGGRDQYTDSVTRLMQISVDLGNRHIIVMASYLNIDVVYIFFTMFGEGTCWHLLLVEHKNLYWSNKTTYHQ